jgi:hypothetical protein
MKQDIQIYVEGKRIDLFGDESIEVTSSIQDVRDISKIFSDYSKSFSIPASQTNNKIFTHYYDSDLINGYDARLRINAEIYVNQVLFRKGTVRLSKATLKNNQPYSYELVFFGSTATLSRILGDDKIKDLDWTNYSHEWTSSNVLQGIQTGIAVGADNRAIVYPLISPKNRIIFDSDAGYTPIENYSNIGSALAGQGLFQQDVKPAVRLLRIIELIESKYSLPNANIQFSRDFFGTDLFNELYLWMHRGDGQIEYSEEGNSRIISNFTLVTQDISCGDYYATFYEDYFEATAVNNTVYSGLDEKSYGARLTITPDDLTATYTYKIKDLVTDQIIFSEETSGEVEKEITLDTDQIEQDFRIQVEISTEPGSPITTYSAEWFILTFYVTDGALTCQNTQTYSVTGQPMIQEVVMGNQTPDLKIIDLLTGIFKMFNLTAYEEDDVIVVDTLDNFYDTYNSYQIDKYIDVDTIDVERVPLYSNISFRYVDPATKLAKKFEELNDEKFGNEEFNVIINDNYIDGTEYGIQLPFEKVVYEKLVDTNNGNQTDIQYGLFVSENDEPIKGNPLIFFNVNTNVNASVNAFYRSADGVTQSNITTYNRPSNVSADGLQTLNFDTENDEFALVYNDNSLFKNFYNTYIEEIFNKTNRITKINGYLPVDILTKYRLNDRFIFNRKEYKINTITTNLNSGKTDFELYNSIPKPVEFIPPCPAPVLSIVGYVSGLNIDVAIVSDESCLDSVVEWSQASDFSSGVFTSADTCSATRDITLNAYGTWYFRAYINCFGSQSEYSETISQLVATGDSFTSEGYTYDAVSQNACEGTPLTLYKNGTDGLYYDSDSGSGNLITGSYYARLNSIYTFSSGIRTFFGYCEEYTAEIYNYNISQSFVCDTQDTVTVYLNTTDGLYYNQPDPSASLVNNSFYSDGTRIYSFSNGVRSEVGFCNLFTAETYAYDASELNVCDSTNNVTLYIDSQDGLYYDSNTGSGNLVTSSYYSDGSFVYSFLNGVRTNEGECDSYTLEVYKYDPILANVCDSPVTENLYLRSADGFYYDSDNGFGSLVNGSYYSINDNVYTMNNGVRTYIQACVGCAGGTLFFVNPIITGMNATLQTGQISYGTGECGTPFSLSFLLSNNEGEWNSASQVVSIQLFEGANDVSGQYNLSNTLVGDVMRINISGNFPDSFNDGDHTYQFRITAYNIAAYTSTISLPSTNAVSHASVAVTPNSELPASRNGSFTNTLLVPAGEDGDAYEYTITYTADEGYEFTGLGNITQPLVNPSGVGVSATTGTYTSSTLTVIVSGNIQANDVSATVSYSGSAIAEAATSVSFEFRYVGQSTWNAIPAEGIEVGEGQNVELRATPDGAYYVTVGNTALTTSIDPEYNYTGDAAVHTVTIANGLGGGGNKTSLVRAYPIASVTSIGSVRFNYIDL